MPSRLNVCPQRRRQAAPALLCVLIISGAGLALVSEGRAEKKHSATPPHEHVPVDSLASLHTGDFPDLDFVHDVVIPQKQVAETLELVKADSLAAYIKHLEDYGTRYVDSPQILEAGYWIEEKLQAFGYSDIWLRRISPDGKVQLATANVVATKSGATVPDYRVVVCGHYDSIVSSDQGSPLDSAPGADDNASGTAATLEIARILADYELDATVMFALFTAEETGLHGSREMAMEFVSDGVPSEKVMVLNMDMIANMDVTPWELVIYDDPLSRPLAQLAGRITEAYTSLMPVFPGISSRSDHYPFQQQGYPAIFYHEAGAHPYYHTVEDKLIHLEMDYAAEVVKSVLANTLHLARIADPPTAVRASQTSSGDLLVEWDHAPDADLLGYYVEIIDETGALLLKRYTADNFVVLNAEEVSGGRWIHVRSEDVVGLSEPSEAALIESDEALAFCLTPNPTMGRSDLDLFIPGVGGNLPASIRIFDAAGRLVRTVYEGPLPRGSNRFQWYEGDAPSGVYFCAVDVKGFEQRRSKIMLVR